MRKKIIFITLYIFFSNTLVSQQALSIYHLQSIPQSSYSNPALIPECKWYFGFPALSSIYFDFGNSGFNINDALYNRADDTIGIDIDNVVNKLGKRNYFSLKTQIELINFGFKVKKNYFSFSANEKFTFRFGYPRDLVSLAWNGNSQFIGDKADFKGLSVNAIHYREFALGYARDLNNKFTIGGRAKLLFGMANIWTNGKSKADLQVADSSYYLTATSYVDINTSIPPQWIEENDNNNDDFDIMNYIFNTDNMGGAIDLGFNYKCSEKVTVSASIIDLGLIHWKTDVKNYKNSNKNASFTFKGIDIKDFFNKSDSAIEDKMENLLDSIADIFNITETEEDYWAPLNSIANFAVTYNLAPKDRLGFVVRGEFYGRAVHPSFTFSYNRKFGQMFDFALTYSITNRSWLDLGLGMSLNLGPFQIYAISDNALRFLVHDRYTFTDNDDKRYSFIYPAYSKNINFQVGLNFVFGYRKIVNVPMLNE